MGLMKRTMAVTAMAVLLSGCSAITYHRGYIVDEVLIASVQPGLDNRESVRATLGQPTMVSQFGEPIWYYVSSRTTQAPFRQPRIRDHSSPAMVAVPTRRLPSRPQPVAEVSVVAAAGEACSVATTVGGVACSTVGC